MTGALRSTTSPVPRKSHATREIMTAQPQTVLTFNANQRKPPLIAARRMSKKTSQPSAAAASRAKAWSIPTRTISSQTTSPISITQFAPSPSPPLRRSSSLWQRQSSATPIAGLPSPRRHTWRRSLSRSSWPAGNGREDGDMPPGTVGDARFVLALAGAAAISGAPPFAADIGFAFLIAAAGLCGIADGTAVAIVGLRRDLTFRESLRLIRRRHAEARRRAWSRLIHPHQTRHPGETP